jgi:hypothetical protein
LTLPRHADVVDPVRLTVNNPVVCPASVAVLSVATIVTTGNGPVTVNALLVAKRV